VVKKRKREICISTVKKTQNFHLTKRLALVTG